MKNNILILTLSLLSVSAHANLPDVDPDLWNNEFAIDDEFDPNTQSALKELCLYFTKTQLQKKEPQNSINKSSEEISREELEGLNAQQSLYEDYIKRQKEDLVSEQDLVIEGIIGSSLLIISYKRQTDACRTIKSYLIGTLGTLLLLDTARRSYTKSQTQKRIDQAQKVLDDILEQKKQNTKS